MSQYVLNEFYIDNLINEVHEKPCYAYLRDKQGSRQRPQRARPRSIIFSPTPTEAP